MGEGITIKDIFIGVADGLDESEREDFLDIFYKGNNKVNELQNGYHKFIITGRKGTGKTILAKFYEKVQNADGVFSKTITNEDFVLKRLLELGNQHIDANQIMSFIEYIILTEIVDILIDNESLIKKRFRQNKLERKKRKRYCRELHGIASLLNHRYEFKNFKTVKISMKKSLLKSIKLNLFWKQQNGELYNCINDEVSKDMEKNEFYSLVKPLRKKIQMLTDLTPVMIIFDDLDEYKANMMENSEFIQFLISIIKVSKSLNRNIFDGKRSKIILLIRQDILQYLNSRDGNLHKKLADCLVNLNWINFNFDKPEEHKLMDLVLSKIQKSDASLEKCTKKELYDMFFPEQVRSKTAISYLMESSFGRPRDIVNYLTIIQEEFPMEKAFRADLFISTEPMYSREFQNELRNELCLYYSPGFTDDCFKLIQFINKTTFYKKDVEAILDSRKNEIQNIESAGQFLDCMYQYGVLGNRIRCKKRNQSSKKYRYSWGYREDGKNHVNLEQEFVVHYALRRSLL